MNEHKYIRDESTNAIINTDVEGLRRYKMQKASSIRMKELRIEVDELRDDMIEIKTLLKTIVERI